MRQLMFAAALLVAVPAAAQWDFDKTEIKTTKLSNSVYMLEGAGGNMAVSVGEDGLVLVDDQFAQMTSKIEAALKALSSKPLRYILNTHFHGDHSGGNAFFSTKGTIVAHENVRKRIASQGNEFGKNGPGPAAALPIVTFDNRLTVWLNGEEIRAVHFPNGHTDGDSVIYFTASKVVHMGDHFFNGMFPFIDVDSGGSVAGVIANLEKILADLPPDAKIIPGHGPMATPADLRENLEALKGMHAAMKAAVMKGKTLEQIKQEKLLAKWEKMSWSFLNTDSFSGLLYKDATKGAPTKGKK
jgi:cyclase